VYDAGSEFVYVCLLVNYYVCFLVIVGKWKVMSEVTKKKKKKRHHSSSSNDFEAPTKRIKVETSDIADDISVLSANNCDRDTSVVEHRQKKKHKHRHAAGVDVAVTGEDSIELSWTSTDGRCNASDVTTEHQTYKSGLEKCSSHKRLVHNKQQNSSLQQQNFANSSQTVDRLCSAELRYTCIMTNLCIVQTGVMLLCMLLLFMAALLSRCGYYILQLWFLLFLLSFFLAYSQQSQIGCLSSSTHDVALV